MAAQALEARGTNGVPIAKAKLPTQHRGMLETVFEIASPVSNPCPTDRKIWVARETLQPLLHECISFVEALEIDKKLHRRNGEQSRIRICRVHFIPNRPGTLLVPTLEFLYRYVDSFPEVSREFGSARRGLATQLSQYAPLFEPLPQRIKHCRPLVCSAPRRAIALDPRTPRRVAEVDPHQPSTAWPGQSSGAGGAAAAALWKAFRPKRYGDRRRLRPDR